MQHRLLSIPLSVFVTLFCCGAGRLALPCRAEATAQNTLSVANQEPAPPPATLQVTAKAGRYTVVADRADVQSVLKLVLDQAEKQFYLDGTVSGQVTMRLVAQPLRTVIDAICAQTLLRYRYDPMTTIYRFERDEEAVRTTIMRVRLSNAILRQQLRQMGLDVPNEDQFRVFNQNGAIQNRGRFFGGMAPSGPPGAPQDALAEERLKQMRRAPAQAKGEKETGEKEGGKRPEEPAMDRTLLPPSGSPEYQQFLAQNNFVSFRIPIGQPQPVTEVLLQLGRQVNVPILIDSSVPTGPKFRIDGTLSPRPLPEALDVLARIARLEWRRIGDKMFVTTAPDFQVFYGASATPRVNSRSLLNTPSRAKTPASAGKPEKTDTQEPSKEKEPP